MSRLQQTVTYQSNKLTTQSQELIKMRELAGKELAEKDQELAEKDRIMQEMRKKLELFEADARRKAFAEIAEEIAEMGLSDEIEDFLMDLKKKDE